MADQPLHLYGIYLSQPVRTVAEFCKLNNIAYDYTPIMPMGGENKTPEYLEISPTGTIPAITHGDFKLYESFAIIQYIAEAYGINNQWWSTDPQQKALINCYLHWHHSTVRNGTFLMFHKAFMKRMTGNDPNPEKVAELEGKVKNALDFVEAILATGKFVARTSEMSVADIAFYNDVMGLKVCEYDFGPYPHVQRLMESIEALAPVQEINAISEEAARDFFSKS